MSSLHFSLAVAAATRSIDRCTEIQGLEVSPHLIPDQHEPIALQDRLNPVFQQRCTIHLPDSFIVNIEINCVQLLGVAHCGVVDHWLLFVPK